MDAQPSRYLTLAHALFEQLRDCQPPPFQSRKVPPHTCCIAHSSRPVACISEIGIDLDDREALQAPVNRRRDYLTPPLELPVSLFRLCIYIMQWSISLGFYT